MKARSVLFSTISGAIKPSVVKTVTQNGVSVSTYQFNKISKIEMSYPEITSFEELEKSMVNQPSVNRAILLIAHKDSSFLADPEALRKIYEVIDPLNLIEQYSEHSWWELGHNLYREQKERDPMDRHHGPYPDMDNPNATNPWANASFDTKGFDLGALMDQLAAIRNERLRGYIDSLLEERMSDHLVARKM